jgi:hypothetical protein
LISKKVPGIPIVENVFIFGVKIIIGEKIIEAEIIVVIAEEKFLVDVGDVEVVLRSIDIKIQKNERRRRSRAENFMPRIPNYIQCLVKNKKGLLEKRCENLILVCRAQIEEGDFLKNGGTI